MGAAAGVCVTVLFLVAVTSAARADSSEFAKGPYIQSLTTKSVTVMWETETPSAGAVEYGETDALDHAIKAKNERELQAVRIDGLAPKTTYFYRVTAGDSKSPIQCFTTLPEKGAFTFIAYGDTRSHPDDHAAVLKAISARKPAFVVHVGDLIEDGHDAALWDPEFFKPAGPLICDTCFFTVAGNHEGESPFYYSYFGAHDGKPWYSFDCSNAHFTMLDSCVALNPGSEQYKWLENDLASTKQRWRFVVFHYPPYSSASHGSDFALRQTLDPLFARHDVDIIFNGHDHDYERTLPIVSKTGNGHPLLYVVTGGGGAPRTEPVGDFWTAAKLSDLEYCVIAIDGDKLQLDAYDVRDRRFDGVGITKDGDGYAKGYPGGTTPEELAQTEAAVGIALTQPEQVAGEGGKSKVTFEFAAPTWSDLELDIKWRKSGKIAIDPTTAHVEIKKGERGMVSAEFTAGETPRDTLAATVSGKTSLGEFKFDMRGVRFKKKQGTAVAAPVGAEAEEE